MTADVIPMHRDAPEQAPHNVEAEQALLGAILINNDAFYRVCDALEAEHFYEPAHQRIYEAVAGLIRAGRTATPVTLKSFAPANTDIGGLTWSQYLARLSAEATSIVNAPDYALTVREHAHRRELLSLGGDLAEKAKAGFGDETTEAILEEAEERLFALRNVDGKAGGFMCFEEALKESINVTAKAYQRDTHLSGIPTGLVDLDQLMGGLQNSDLIILAGRPSMGKTALATNIAYSVAENGGTVGFFSLEMSAEQLSTRILADRCSIPSSRMRRGDINEGEFEKITSEARRLSSLPLYIEQTGGLSIVQLISRARRMRRQRGLDLMVVDYLQLLGGSNRSARDNRVQELTEITTKLKALAKEFGVPILALSQLSRQVESRDNKRPQLSDLRDSGSIEQDADVVLFVYREEYYLQNREPRQGTEEYFKWETALKAAQNKAEVVIGKQRHGPTGFVTLSFEPHFTRFGNLAREERLPERSAG